MINIRDDKIDCIIIIYSFSSLFFIRIIILLSIIYTDIQTKIIPGTQKIAIIKISPSHILYNPIFMSNVASPSTAYWPLKSGFSNIYFLFWGRGDAPSLSAALSSIGWLRFRRTLSAVKTTVLIFRGWSPENISAEDSGVFSHLTSIIQQIGHLSRQRTRRRQFRLIKGQPRIQRRHAHQRGHLGDAVPRGGGDFARPLFLHVVRRPGGEPGTEQACGIVHAMIVQLDTVFIRACR